ncbi:V-type ATP synthase subunit E [Clostridium thermarum]|uniref:V-type ATP synthase subunit E n=1 Tax=Clostridium thermarum TaxID=1716543 RepID=UPI0013D5502F|nr:V-type ATP synthase subunit E [Clostridium thermarum]
MSDINILIDKIIKDAERQVQEILQSAAEEEKAIVAKRIAAAEAEKAEKITKAKSEAVLKKERVISSATLEARNRKLAAKQEIISKVFDQALESMKTLPQDRYLSFIKNSLIALDLKGNEIIRISKQDINKIDEAFLAGINSILSSEGKAGNLKLSSNYGDFSGGFIVENGGIEINYTFEALLDSVKDDLVNEVANILFS